LSDLLLGLDVGTTHTKGLLYDPASGAVIAQQRVQTPSNEPRPGWREYDPQAIWASVRECIRALSGSAAAARRVAAVAVASMGESGALCDAQGHPLGPIIAWHDSRTTPQRDWWAAHLDPFHLYQLTGQRLTHIFGVNKLLWQREHCPDLYARSAKWLSIEDQALQRLSGALATDYTIASRTMLLDQRRGAWAAELLDLAGLPADLFPAIHPSGTAVGQVTAAAAQETGLPLGAAVVTGGHDHLCAALACGATRPGAFLDSTGTAEAMLWIRERFDPTPELFALGYSSYRHVAPGAYVLQGGLDTGGAFLEWSARLLGVSVGEMLTLAEQSAPGAGGLVALPFLRGKGTPRREPRMRGAFANLGMEHSRAELARAAVESLGFWLRANLEALGGLFGQRPAEIIVTGGVNRSPFVCQLKADITGLPVLAPEIEEGAALGAALLAGLGAGLFASAEEAQASVRARAARYLPDGERHALYVRYAQEEYAPILRALLSRYRS
jgi:sugar (pentulose or hexulose) kinase